MTYETVEQTINLLCEKLGIVVDSATGVAEQLIPELVRMGIWTEAIKFSVFTLIIIGLSIACVKTTKLYMNTDCRDNWWSVYEVLNIASCAVSFIGIPILLFESIKSLLDLMKWIVAPNIKAIEYITSLIG